MFFENHIIHYVVNGSCSILPFSPSAKALNPLRREASLVIIDFFNAAMCPRICQPRKVVFLFVKASREEMSQFQNSRNFSSQPIYFSGPAVFRSLIGKYFLP